MNQENYDIETLLNMMSAELMAFGRIRGNPNGSHGAAAIGPVPSTRKMMHLKFAESLKAQILTTANAQVEAQLSDAGVDGMTDSVSYRFLLREVERMRRDTLIVVRAWFDSFGGDENEWRKLELALGLPLTPLSWEEGE